LQDFLAIAAGGRLEILANPWVIGGALRRPR
jgi:hypothetical protein